MSDSSDSTWKLCSICKRPLRFGDDYYACSVSTCNRSRTALFFCSVQCWDAHLPEARHRDAWAEPQKAPSREAYQLELSEAEASEKKADPEPARRRVVSAPRDDIPRDILIVVSKLKSYVRARSGMNTSDGVMPVLSEHLRKVCDAAVAHAAQEGRKTLLDRDFEPVVRNFRRSSDD